ncbi:MAG: secretin and TonB N-terminal domain-containing protein [Gammaproteobacteria bacterium]|nr:secretin and TonB N-terminal domain-containing protein [Gammaproteobacteria bacterium]
MKRRMIPLAGGILLAGCTVHAPIDTSVDRSVAAPAPEVATDAVANAVPVPLTLEQRLAYPSPDITAPRTAGEHLYSFVAQNLPISQALQIFREAYQLNIVTDSDVAGTLTVDFRDLPFDQAMEAMLDSLGLYWSREGNLIRVRSRQTRTFVIDYIRLVRSGSGSSLAQIASNSSSSSGSTAGSGSGTSASGESGKITIEQSDTVQFWSELEEQIGTLTSESGRLVINRMAGTIQVTDAYPRVQEIGRFVNEINRAVHRQVDIDVRIVEVSLNDDFSLGIDWSRLTPNGNTGVEFNLQTGNIVTQPAGGFNAKLPTLATDIFSVNSNGVFDFTAMLDALREQGTVRVVSQPQIRALNNQSAMIKVGTDRTFFRREVTTNSTTSGSTIESEDVPQVVTEGIVLALTPQIATSGWIMLDVSPVVTRVSSIATALDENGNVRSTAPNLDIRQASSLVRVRNGETIVIGGLIQDQQSDTERTVPGIGNVPVLGRLFGGTYQVRGKKELVMFLTARLVESRDMAALN